MTTNNAVMGKGRKRNAKTIVVRMRPDDAALLARLSGLDTDEPFPTKVHEALRRLAVSRVAPDSKAMRRVVRQELQRCFGGM